MIVIKNEKINGKSRVRGEVAGFGHPLLPPSPDKPSAPADSWIFRGRFRFQNRLLPLSFKQAMAYKPLVISSPAPVPASWRSPAADEDLCSASGNASARIIPGSRGARQTSQVRRQNSRHRHQQTPPPAGIATSRQRQPRRRENPFTTSSQSAHKVGGYGRFAFFTVAGPP